MGQTKQQDYAKYNAQPVLDRLNEMIEQGCSRKIRAVYEELSIFDWWPEMLTLSRMRQMRSFLKEAIKLGFTGYVCFKVGASGCANGMWAHKENSTNGYSPDGDYIYRSFTPDYTNWQANIDSRSVPECLGMAWDSCTTIKEFETALNQAFAS